MTHTMGAFEALQDLYTILNAIITTKTFKKNIRWYTMGSMNMGF